MDYEKVNDLISDRNYLIYCLQFSFDIYYSYME